MTFLPPAQLHQVAVLGIAGRATTNGVHAAIWEQRAAAPTSSGSPPARAHCGSLCGTATAASASARRAPHAVGLHRTDQVWSYRPSRSDSPSESKIRSAATHVPGERGDHGGGIRRGQAGRSIRCAARHRIDGPCICRSDGDLLCHGEAGEWPAHLGCVRTILLRFRVRPFARTLDFRNLREQHNRQYGVSAFCPFP